MVHNWIVTWTITTYTNFAACLCLVWIFLKFRDKKPDLDRRTQMTMVLDKDDVNNDDS